MVPSTITPKLGSNRQYIIRLIYNLYRTEEKDNPQVYCLLILPSYFDVMLESVVPKMVHISM